MDPKDPNVQRWLEGWRVSGEMLEKLRRERIRNTDTQQAIMELKDAFEATLIDGVTRNTSGLVIQQALFRRLRT